MATEAPIPTGELNDSERSRIYYDDGRVLSINMLVDKNQIPLHDHYGVIAVVQPSERTGREILHDKDWYLFRSDVGRWFACDDTGMKDQIVTFASHVDCVLVGRLMERMAYEAIINRAIDDAGLPPMFVRRT